MKSLSFKNAHVFVTGASSGIGRELAYCFAEEGARLTLVARRLDRLDELAKKLQATYNTEALVISTDLTDPGSRVKAIEQARAQFGPIDCLVNNAGVGVYGNLVDVKWEKTLFQMKINMEALVHLTYLVLPEMIKRRSGSILNIASVVSFMAIPVEAVYAATKSFVLSFTEGIYPELRPYGIRVCALCPGTTDTEFFDTGNFKRDAKFQRAKRMNPRHVAKVGISGLKKGKLIAIPGILNKISLLIIKPIPRKLLGRFLNYIMK